MTDKVRRTILAICGLGAWGLILFAWLYLEKTLYLSPCPLCMMQRFAFAIGGSFMLVEAIFWPRKPVARMFLALGKYGGIFFGMGLAARHLYIQSLPPGQVPACGFDFWGTLAHNGFWQGLAISMRGSGDCAELQKFLGLSIPVWSMLAFIGLLFTAIIFGNPKYRMPTREYY